MSCFSGKFTSFTSSILSVIPIQKLPESRIIPDYASFCKT